MYILGHIELQKLVGATENTVINMYSPVYRHNMLNGVLLMESI